MKNKSTLVAIFIFVVFSNPIFGQEDLSLKYASTIQASDLKKHLTYLASDELRGRDTGSEGQKMAADYLIDFYKTNNLKGPVNGSYLQPFQLSSVSWKEVSLKIGKSKLVLNEDFVFVGDADMKRNKKTDLVFLGLASDENLSKVEVEGKLVGLWAIGNSVGQAVEKVMDAGAAGALIVTMEGRANFDRMANRYKSLSGKGRMGFDKPTEQKPVFMVSSIKMAELFESPVDLLKEAAKNDPSVISSQKAVFKVVKQKDFIDTENVMAFAQAARDGYNPRRSILFLNVTGEEKGLLGSEYYSENPIFPLENTVNNINIDMVGRIDYEYQDAENQDYVYVIGSEMLSSQLKVINEYNNITYTNLILDYRYDAEDDPNRFYYRSDHYNFAKHNIPVIFFFNGVHDDYHKPTDTVDKIEFDLMEKRAKLIFHTAWDLANRENRTPVDGTNNRTDR